MILRSTRTTPGPAFAYNLRFPGQYYDVETGKHYNYFRDYDPAIGRYLESDPIGLKGGLNIYGYVNAAPLRYIDPAGLEPVSMCVIEAFNKNFNDMRNANVKNSDKFFHCKANCDAARCGKGSYDMACKLSDAREAYDQFKVCAGPFCVGKGDSPFDSQEDQYANSYGRGWGANTKIDCAMACQPFRPNGLGSGPYYRPPPPPPLF